MYLQKWILNVFNSGNQIAVQGGYLTVAENRYLISINKLVILEKYSI